MAQSGFSLASPTIVHGLVHLTNSAIILPAQEQSAKVEPLFVNRNLTTNPFICHVNIDERE